MGTPTATLKHLLLQIYHLDEAIRRTIVQGVAKLLSHQKASARVISRDLAYYGSDAYQM